MQPRPSKQVMSCNALLHTHDVRQLPMLLRAEISHLSACRASRRGDLHRSLQCRLLLDEPLMLEHMWPVGRGEGQGEPLGVEMADSAG